MTDRQSQANIALDLGTALGEDSMLSEENVVHFLKTNPDFFVRHPKILEDLEIPHGHKGSVSLVEMQGEQLRKKIRQLTFKLNQLFSVARQNEKLFRIYSNLNVNLMACTEFSGVETLLDDVMTNELGLSSVVIKLFSGAHALPELQRRLIVEKRFQSEDFFFGRLSQHEKQLLFGNLTAESVALMQLGDNDPIGLVAVGSKDAGHFTPDMDTLLIKQLRRVLNIMLPKILDL